MELYRTFCIPGYMGLVAYLSLAPRFPTPVESAMAGLGSQLLHGGAYFGLVFVLGCALRGGLARRVLIATALSLLYGLALEVAQLGVPSRTFSGIDLLYNMAGATLGAIAYTSLRLVPNRYSPRQG